MPSEHSSRPGVNESEGTKPRHTIVTPDDCAMQNNSYCNAG
ncbi:hypothetical protein CFIICLFH_3889 [Methylobacterium goesingense]|uniref:Uncharacterized protein n=1 Tax=Methylobacterium goesingense TaxID=243690 RepID=A0ABV2L038_9HYPH|nr:hypothetical protein CFIICLFH_3889 [Methylobacterium goesingense]